MTFLDSPIYVGHDSLSLPLIPSPHSLVNITIYVFHLSLAIFLIFAPLAFICIPIGVGLNASSLLYHVLTHVTHIVSSQS